MGLALSRPQAAEMKMKKRTVTVGCGLLYYKERKIPVRRKPLRIGVDVDDVLYDCNQHAIDLLCAEKEYSPMSIYDISSWGSVGSILDARIDYFSRSDFVQNQPVLPGAQEFIRKLSQRGEVIFTTAVGGACMSSRAERLMRDFPEVPERNIMVGARKDLLSLDLLLDDGAHNILKSNAKYPVLFRRPWNEQLTGLLSVNSFDDFIQLVDRIGGYQEPGRIDLSRGGIVCLIGPTGSGKTSVVEALMKSGRFARPHTTTTRERRPGESDTYHFVSRDKFVERKERGDFLETTVYGGEYYGATREETEQIVSEGRIALMPVDICGGISIKNAYPAHTALVFLLRARTKALQAILRRNCEEEEKILRILSLDAEYRNEDICDLTLNMNEPMDLALESLKRGLSLI